MHYVSICILLMTLVIVINARSSNSHRSCPEEYRELRRRDDDDDSNSDDDQYRENMCEQTMDMATRQRNNIKNRSMLRTYCAHHDESLELARENDDTKCENKKREIDIKRKRQESKKKRDDDPSNGDDDDDDKRRALHKRELLKRVALRFIHKRLS